MDNTERYIYKLYKSIDVSSRDHLSIDCLSSIFDIDIRTWEYTSELVHYKGKYKMFINENLNKRQQWQDFGHEICHYFWHRGTQRYLSQMYIDYQEHKADYFAYHFCVPTFMLAKLREVNVYKIMNLFNVEFDFALRRLEMYKNKLLEGRIIWQEGMSDIVAETSTKWR